MGFLAVVILSWPLRIWCKRLAGNLSPEGLTKGRYWRKLVWKTSWPACLLILAFSSLFSLGAQNSEKGGEIIGQGMAYYIFILWPILAVSAWNRTKERFPSSPSVGEPFARPEPLVQRPKQMGGKSKIIAGIVLAVAMGTGIYWSHRPLTLTDLAKKAAPAVVLLNVYDGEGKEIRSGSGFFIFPVGDIVTNWHVIDAADSVIAKSSDGKIHKIKGIRYGGPKNDIAVLEVEYPESTPKISFGDSNAIQPGERVALIGSPLGLEGSLCDGIVAAKRHLESGQDWLQITAPISHGSSGSPVLNFQGEVIGIAASTLEGGQALNFAIPVALLKQAYRSDVVSYPIAERSALAEEDDIYRDPAYQDALAQMRLGNTSGDYSKAIELFSFLEKKYPASAQISTRLSCIYMVCNRFHDGLSASERAVARDSGSASAWLALGNACEKLGDYSRGIKAMAEALELKPDMISAYFYWQNIGAMYLLLNDNANAATAVDNAVAADSERRSDIFKEYRLELVAEGNRAFGVKNFQKATEAFGLALQDDANYADAWLGLWKVYYAEGDTSNAFQAATRYRQLTGSK